MDKAIQKRVFVSSTYKNLKKTRIKVREKLYGLSYGVVGMETFPAGDAPLGNSIKQLEKGCDYYILLIGSNYGTIPKGKTISITHAEYRKAHEMKLNNEIEKIFVFVGKDDAPLKADQEESVELQEKRKKFLKEIGDNYSYRTYEDEETLFDALYQTLANEANPFLANDVEVFERFDQIRHLIDENAEGKYRRIGIALNEFVEEFSPVFNLKNSSGPDLNHPIVSKVRDILDESIPSNTFDTSFGGRVDSWGIRQIVFRIETVIKLMLAIKDRSLLNEIGQEIGRSACIDLFEKVILKNKNRKLIPSSLKAFIELFDYWDSSAGWGKLDFQEQDEKNGKWILLTKNNFLTDKAGGQTDDEIIFLYAFWEGYITGALDEALTKLSLLYSELSTDLKNNIILPAYTRIISVKKDPDESMKDVDIFHVYFEKHPYKWAFDILSTVKTKLLNAENIDDERIFTLMQLSGLLNELQSSNKKYYKSVIAQLTKDEQKIVTHILNHKNDNLQIEVNQCIDITNQVLQKFVNSKS
ncbi:DUF4062 domain-containing protein [Spirosoma sp.]|uniref:DUF4062 domain-containing protein n=1 Tax=Spirosoma sp. TaxID=1899569 RepID=UPI003B3A8E7E